MKRLSRILILCLFSTGCGKPSGPGAGPGAGMTRPPASVTVATAVARDVPVYLDEIGRSASRETVSILSQVSGRVTTLWFSDGADVKRGDMLFSIDPRPFEASLLQAQAGLAQSKANLEFARVELERYAALVKTS